MQDEQTKTPVAFNQTAAADRKVLATLPARWSGATKAPPEGMTPAGLAEREEPDEPTAWRQTPPPMPYGRLKTLTPDRKEVPCGPRFPQVSPGHYLLLPLPQG